MLASRIEPRWPNLSRAAFRERAPYHCVGTVSVHSQLWGAFSERGAAQSTRRRARPSLFGISLRDMASPDMTDHLDGVDAITNAAAAAIQSCWSRKRVRRLYKSAWAIQRGWRCKAARTRARYQRDGFVLQYEPVEQGDDFDGSFDEMYDPDKFFFTSEENTTYTSQGPYVSTTTLGKAVGRLITPTGATYPVILKLCASYAYYVHLGITEEDEWYVEWDVIGAFLNRDIIQDWVVRNFGGTDRIVFA